MTRTPTHLAALASTAVPGLDPVTVQAMQGDAGRYYEVAFVTDSQHRTWVVRAPLTPAAGAQMDASVALLGLIGRRLPFSVPAPRGFVTVPEGRAVVYPHIAGRPIDLASLPPGPGLAAEVGRMLAAIHNLDREVVEEALLPVYDAETYRSRRLADLDRGAATGHVPTTLLSRWERSLEDVSLWRFAPTPIHGDITGEQVLVVFDDESDVTTGRVRGVTGWDDAKVADPAEDLAEIVSRCDPRTLETVLEAYSNHRVERPDPHLRRRAGLAAEMRLLSHLLSAVGAGRRNLIRTCASALRELDDRTVDAPDEPTDPGGLRRRGSRWLPADETAYDRTRGASGDGPSREGPAAPEPPADDATQPVTGSPFAEDTTVIPDAELARLRAERVSDEAAADEDEVGAGDDPTDAAGQGSPASGSPVTEADPEETRASSDPISHEDEAGAPTHEIVTRPPLDPAPTAADQAPAADSPSTADSPPAADPASPAVPPEPEPAPVLDDGPGRAPA